MSDDYQQKILQTLSEICLYLKTIAENTSPTEEVREENITKNVSDFLKIRVEKTDSWNDWISRASLYSEYLDFCNSHGWHDSSVSRTKFGRELAKEGLGSTTLRQKYGQVIKVTRGIRWR